MELFRALEASDVGVAVRPLVLVADRSSDERPNMAILAGKRARAFRHTPLLGRESRSVAVARRLYDWVPAESRDAPVYLLPGAVCDRCGRDISGQLDDKSGEWLCAGILRGSCKERPDAS